MFSEAKVTEIYCMADDFYKEYVCKHLIVYCYNSLSLCRIDFYLSLLSPLFRNDDVQGVSG